MTITSSAKDSLSSKLEEIRSCVDNLGKIEELLSDKMRAAQFILGYDNSFKLDLTRQPIDAQILSKLLDVAKSANLQDKINSLMTGKIVNLSENRAAEHCQMRAINNLSPSVKQLHQKMQDILQAIGDKDVIWLGIGGSDLGPRLVCQALANNYQATRKIHFVANSDGNSLHKVLTTCVPENTVCVICSKSFKTIETLSLAQKVQTWFEVAKIAPADSLYAITANAQLAKKIVPQEDNILLMSQSIGGRYSLWSAVGLAIALQFDFTVFLELLAGAQAVDNHFATVEFKQNIPVLLALVSILHINVLQHQTHAIIPYTDSLALLPEFLQQLEMESNGKAVNEHGEILKINTAPIIWGGVGCNVQHAFMQLLHQSKLEANIDFLIVAHNSTDSQLDDLLISSCIAQAKALISGKDDASAAKVCPGNRANSLFILRKLTAYTLGQLLATFEHKTFVQAAIWGNNPFDQWGVELGKELNTQLLAMVRKQDLEGASQSIKDTLEVLYNMRQ